MGAGEGEPTILEAKKVSLLVVDEVEEPLLTEEHLYLVEGFSLPASELCGRYGPLLAIHSASRRWGLCRPPSKCAVQSCAFITSNIERVPSRGTLGDSGLCEAHSLVLL